MTKIENVKFNHLAEHYVYTLENADKILVHARELNDESATFESVQGVKYYPVFAEREYEDEQLEIVGFEEELKC